MLNGVPYLDLNYPEDVAADVDFNVVLNDDLNLIELQGTAEEGSYTRAQLNQMLDLAEKGIGEVMALQRRAIAFEIS